MKILMVSSVPENFEEIKGGIEAVTINLLNEFYRYNISIYLVSFRKEILKERVVEYSDTIRIHYFPYNPLRSKILELVFLGRRKIRRIICDIKPDIIHLQGSLPNILYLIGIPKHNVIITKHGIYEEEYKYQIGFKTRMKFFIKMKMEKILIRNYRNFIFISNYNKKILLHNINGIKSKVIPIPINNTFFNKTNSISKPNKILYVGVINKRKGLFILLKAVSMLKSSGKNYTVDIVGGFMEKDYENKIKRLIIDNGLNNLVKFHGWLSQQKIKQLMSEINITVLPSYQETTPGIIAETMAFGNVVVATNVGGISEMFNNYETGFLFEKGNTDQLVNILDNLYDNKQLLRNVGAKARILAKKIFYPNNVVKRTISFYEQINS